MELHLPDARACPSCGKVNNLHTSDDADARPEPGDLSICWGCLAPAAFTSVGLRKLTEAEAKGPMGGYYRRIIEGLLADPPVDPYEAARRIPRR